MPCELLSFQAALDRYLQKTSTALSSRSFANIYAWQDFFQFRFEEIDGNLCVFATEEAGTFLYLPPLGESISPKAVEYSFERMRQINKSSSVTRIENVSQEQLKFFATDKYKIYKKGYEYLYFRNDLVRLKGQAYKSKRHACRHFEKSFSAAFLGYDPSMAKECLELFAEWEKHKRLTLTEDIDLALLEDALSVHRRVLKDFQQLNVIGRVVEVNARIAGYTFGYFVGQETFCDLLEITDPQYSGLGAYIFNQLCQDPALLGVKFINVMDDCAPQNVNRTKMSFRPAALLPVYNVSLLG
jgi:hypothetical protein